MPSPVLSSSQAINELIPGTVPLRLESGSLGVLTADLGTSLSPSAAPAPAHGAGSSTYSLNIALSHLHLNLVLDPARAIPSADASQSSDGAAAPMVDLASSVLSVADEFVHRELDAQEGQDLLNSVRTLRRDQSSDPFVSPDAGDDDDDDLWLPPGAMRPFVDRPRAEAVGGGGGAAAGGKPADAEGAKTLVMGFVEGLMARLKVNVKDVRVRVRFASPHGGDDDDDDEDGVGAVELELRMSAVSYQDEPSPHSSSGADPSVSGGKAKTLRFSSFKVVMLQPPPPTSSPSTPMRRSSTPTLFQSSTLRSSATSHSSHSSSSSSDGDPHSTLMMSQAIADLRDSKLDDASQSLYESATEGASSFLTPTPLHEDRNPLDSQAEPLANTASLPQGGPPAEVWRTLLSLGDEDIVLRFTPAPPATTSHTAPVRPQAPSLQRSSSSSSSDMGSRPTSRIASAVLQGPAVSLYVPAVAVLVLPEQFATMSRAVGLVLAGQPPPPPPSPVPSPEELRRSAAPHLLLYVRSILLVAVYTDDEIPPATLDSFWSRPRGGVLPAGHLVARVGRIEAHSNPHASAARPTANRAASRKAGLSRSPSSMGHAGPFKEVPSSTTDLALFVEDFSLFEHLSPAVVASSAGTSNPSPAVAPIIIMDPDLPSQYDFGSAGSFPDFESQDWRSGGRARKAGAVEKAWRVRSGRAKFAAAHAEASPVDIGPTLRASRSLAPGEGAFLEHTRALAPVSNGH